MNISLFEEYVPVPRNEICKEDDPPPLNNVIICSEQIEIISDYITCSNESEEKNEDENIDICSTEVVLLKNYLDDQIDEKEDKEDLPAINSRDNIKKHYDKIMNMKDSIIEEITKNPAYISYKCNAEKSMKVYNFVALVLSIGTFNPAGIIYGLYRIGVDLE